MKERLAVVVLFLLVFSGLSSSQFEGWPGSSLTGPANDFIDFGDVAVGRTVTAQYTFKVLETSQTSVRVSFSSPCAPFGFSGLASRSLTLPPGGSVRFDVTFTPQGEKHYTCSFTIRASGGRPVQTSETVVRLSGRGVTDTETPSETPAIPGLPGELPLTAAPTAGETDGVVGTTDPDGAFEVTIPPASTVAGHVSACGGPALSEQAIQVAPVDGKYQIAVEGYVPVLAEPVEKVSFLGMESIELGDVCLEPAPAALETAETSACPCCAILIEALTCCPPRSYVEADTVYGPQDVRIRVAYCEPPAALGETDLTTLPRTTGGDILWDPDLVPADLSMEPTAAGVRSVLLDGAARFEGDAVHEKTIYAGTLNPGAHAVRAVIGRLNGEVCTCEKSFEVLRCPTLDAALHRTLEPADGCAPVQVSYRLDGLEGTDELCELFLDYRDTLHLDRQDALSFTDTVSGLDPCTPRRVEPVALLQTCNGCSYEVPAEPFVAHPPFRMHEDCICLRLIPNEDGIPTTQLVFRWRSPSSDPPGCVLCDDYDLSIDWGDGTTSSRSDIMELSPSQPDAWIVPHTYTTNPEDPRPPIDITVIVRGPCGSLETPLSGRCELPAGLVAERELERVLERAAGITEPIELIGLINELNSTFAQVGESVGGTTICSVLFDLSVKGLDMGPFGDFDRLVSSLWADELAGGIFQRDHRGGETEDRRWRLYRSPQPSGATRAGAAKLVYRPGPPPYFGVTILQGGCDDCPVQPTYRIASTLTDIEARQRIREAERSLGNPSTAADEAGTGPSIRFTLQIGLCCPPSLCEE